ncbi:MAG: AmmeMemoRadiSam system radical SAM enzyme [Treponema sp.]|jgi:pyruvate formate lyase activating enzyme|nr:AmmeMemoRadiSam system radical SAM enzyme [Treponema sp.]
MAYPPDREIAGALRCSLCPHRCRIPPGGRGLCGVRENAGGSLKLPYAAYVTAAAWDPIEKKPLYHFRPGVWIFSLGFAGCNLRCPFCQNWQISQLRGRGRPQGRELQPEEALVLAEAEPPSGAAGGNTPSATAKQIAYTYSEPLIHFEYLKTCMELAHCRGIANVLVSNGCIEIEKAREILPLVDAANIDLKCFSEKTYRDILGGNLETVLEFIRAARGCGVCLELTTLVVPGLNDSDAELDRCAEFIAGLEADGGRPLPWHLSAYHPGYRWEAPPTDPAALLRAAARARKSLPFVYPGNIPGEENDTACPHCGAVLIRRRGYRVESRLSAPAGNPAASPRPLPCPCCGRDTPVYW